MKTALSYATDDELSVIREACQNENATRQKVARLRETLVIVQNEMLEARQTKPKHLAAAAARALGEVVEAVPINYVNTYELRDREEGLRQLLADAEIELRYAQGAVKTATHGVMRAVADRIGAEYVAAAKQLGWLWTQLAAIESFTGHASNVVPVLNWNKLRIPGTDMVPSIKAAARYEYGESNVVTAERLTSALPKAQGEIAQHGRELVGGWPL